MPASSSSGDPPGSTLSKGSSNDAALSRASGELVHEQTVRAPIPVSPSLTTETTVRVPMPTLAQEQTVRAFVPSAVGGNATAPASEVEELEEVDVEPETEAESVDPKLIDVSALVSELEAQVRSAKVDVDVPVSRSEQVTVPEAAAKTSELLASAKRESRGRGKRGRTPEGAPPRPEPPAVSGEVSVSEAGPSDLFEPPARREERVRAKGPARASTPRRDDPPVVKGEVAIDPAAAKTPEVPAGDVRVMPMTSSGPQAVMTSSGAHPTMTSSGPQALMPSSGSHPIMLASGPQPMMTSSGTHPVVGGSPSTAARNSSGSHPVMTASGASPVVPRRASTDGGFMASDATGPHARVVGGMHLRRRGESSRDSMVLWVLAGALVVLALGVVMMVISWAQ